MADAVGYARNQWGKLVAYVEHGQTRIDNNLTAQAIRPCKLGAKNWLFSWWEVPPPEKPAL